jgi:hypothetical protein
VAYCDAHGWTAVVQVSVSCALCLWMSIHRRPLECFLHHRRGCPWRHVLLHPSQATAVEGLRPRRHRDLPVRQRG